MKLVSAKLRGYRRFEDATADLDGRVIAIIGPNEAGKSSLLEALVSIENDEPFAPEDVTRDLTEPPRPGDFLVECRFTLDPEDQEGLQGLGGLGQPRWFVIKKRLSGRRLRVLEPDIKRDLGARDNLRDAMGRSLRNTHLRSLMKERLKDPEEDTQIRLADFVTRLREAVDSEAPTLDAELLSVFRHLREHLGELWETESVGKPPGLKNLVDALDGFLSMEDAEHPRDRAIEYLEQCRPKLVLFGDPDRRLRPEYPRKALSNPPPALQNLFALAGVDPTALAQTIADDRAGDRVGLQRQANHALQERFAMAWQQSNVYPFLHFEPDIVRIHVPTRGSLAPIAERSDGLRAFVALIAFTEAQESTAPPILLIDEAERHLHYDAQADLIQVFERQAVVPKIIYSTHSAGCLPSDLGVGIRAVKPESLADGRDAARSTITSAFWSEGLGFSPLLFAMGAAAMAFVPSRRAVLTEGRSDPILLPSLLREATGLDRLDFQVAPGLARASRTEVAELDLEAPRVAYLLDGDPGGREHARDLKKAGVAPTDIVHLPKGRVLEDFIAEEVYLQAVNDELCRSYGKQAHLKLRLRTKGRPNQIREACEAAGFSEPKKVRVLQRVLDRQGQVAIVDDRRREDLIGVYDALAEVLGLKPTRKVIRR